jgi:hypothetical protein
MCWDYFHKVWQTDVLGVKLIGSGKFCCLVIFNRWLLKLFYVTVENVLFFQYWCDFDLIVVHSYLILCCVKMMMGSGELYGLDIFTVRWFKSDMYRCLFVLFLIYLIFVLHFDFMCSSVSRFEQMQTEILLMYMLQPSKFNPMVQRPWTTQTFLRWKTLVPLHSTRT